MGAVHASKISNTINRSIVWLDASVNDTEEYINAQQLLGASTDHLKSFTDDKACEKYIQSLPKGHRIILIVGGRSGQLIVPRIHQLIQISSIFVYCMDRRTEEWTKIYKKVKNVTEDINELVIQVLSAQEKQTTRDRFESQLLINVCHTSGTREKSTTELNGQFVHSQMLIDCLLRIKSNSTDKNEFITYSKKEYAKNDSQLDIIREFEENYSADQALKWYTRECFLYQLLNKALRVQNIDLLYLFGFFIRDLRNQLEQYRYPSLARVYRSQLISKKELQQLKSFMGQLISMNSFLSTTLDREVAVFYLGDIEVSNGDLQPVLFEIEADPRIDGVKPFANITPFSYIPDEEEILMMLGSIFRLVHIRYEGQLCIIQLKLSSENGHDVKPIFDQMKIDYLNEGHSSVGEFGIVLANMGKFDEAERYLLRLLDESPPDHHTKETKEYNLSVCYVNLGNVAERKGDFNRGLVWYQRALCIRLQLRRSNDPSIADIHNLVGASYYRKGEYKSAIESYNEALKIYRHNYGEDHTKLAVVFSNIAAVYLKQEKYLEALDCQKKVLNIYKKNLHENHYLLGGLHTNMATAYLYLHNSDLALEHFNQALTIFQKTLPPNHPDFAAIYNNMGTIYIEKRNLQQALAYYEKAAVILNQTVGPTHPDAISIQRNIQYIQSFIPRRK
ncbi:unnamed protein product [Rotaria socialis]|uniref:Uncharacterized protein n=1 Tax=Rotaria socialis TaxID=392032 RepID=A0A817T045_9BILA|nr:unnamed protein product [Rotaria socialis]CAF3305427.1 unnamed protein product [Rotaria socialis]CAF3765896.1 unnamed protein product [Rotaria socialis]CAF4337193.1 unnamed protein product [Rotaria socialis]CAF4395518.1 unnamed protein product [Rotaria socialis]